MKNLMMLSMVFLSGCGNTVNINVPAATATGADSSVAAGGSLSVSTVQPLATFSIAPTGVSGYVKYINGIGVPSLLAYDNINGVLSIGDTSSEPKRAGITFPISSLAGKTTQGVTLTLKWEAQSSVSFVSNIGEIRIYKIGWLDQNQLNSNTVYSAAEGTSFSLVDNSVLNLSTNSPWVHGDPITIDITTILNQSIQQGDGYLTFKIRSAQESATGNNLLNFMGANQADNIVISGKY